MALGLTVHIDGPELGHSEELEGCGKVVIRILLAGCLTKILYTFFINSP
jgi:hypothetical protein